MKLRDRLLLFSTAQLLLFGVLFALAYGAFARGVLPMLEHMLEAKSQVATHAAGNALEVPLGADDLGLVTGALATLFADPDLAYVAIRDNRDQPKLSHGAPVAEPFGGTPGVAAARDGYIRTWEPVTFEGMKLGSVSVAFSTTRLDAIGAWARRIALGVLLIWLAALGYSVVFARSFVSPIHAMMLFSRKVAGGALAERLTIAAPGELRALRDYLNQMTAALERREAEQKEAAAHVEKIQHELLTVSRMAGMAEIATGVLHNVGNVLNSLNVSVSMISDQVRGSRIAGLSRSIELVDSFPGGLPAFLDTAKGKALPTYLSTVSRRLTEENAKMLEELGSVNRHVDHIKTIVAMQQSYAHPAGVLEHVVISAVINDALHMGESSFARHGIEVIKDYSNTLGVLTDRHKLLQILINLISNARHALKDHRAPPQQLTVRARETATAIEIEISDTGVGIPAENLDKIFQHGFTTRARGHGFGLHASANAARELGGTLQARSEGPGRGATFTLEIPLEGKHAVQN